MREIKQTDTFWYLYYIRDAPKNDRLRKEFRDRFRLPHDSFLDLVNEISQHHLFNRCTKKDCTGHESSNLHLLLLGSLRYIGRGLTFDDIEEATVISAEVCRIFLHVFWNTEAQFYIKHITDAFYLKDLAEYETLFKLVVFNAYLMDALVQQMPHM